jgi:actin-related protein 9
MASQTGKWREDQILVICPGSHTTMAQLGCGELTPPAFRIPTRMFRDEENPGEWMPYYTKKRKKLSPATGGDGSAAQDATKADAEEWQYVEDPDSTEGAVYPIQGSFSYLTELRFFRNLDST